MLSVDIQTRRNTCSVSQSMAATRFSGLTIGHDLGAYTSSRDAAGEQVEHRYLPTLPESLHPTCRSAVHLRGTRREEWTLTTGTCPSINAL